MAEAVASGMPKLKIEECAARRQARIDTGAGRSGVYFIMGVYLSQVYFITDVFYQGCILSRVCFITGVFHHGCILSGVYVITGIFYQGCILS